MGKPIAFQLIEGTCDKNVWFRVVAGGGNDIGRIRKTGKTWRVKLWSGGYEDHAIDAMRISSKAKCIEMIEAYHRCRR